MRKIVADPRPHGVDARHEGGVLFRIENAYRDEGLKQLNGDEPCARQTREGQGAIALAVLDEPIDTADLVDLCVADGRHSLCEQINLFSITAPSRRFTMDDAIGETP